jgi:hypothetical protein
VVYRKYHQMSEEEPGASNMWREEKMQEIRK